jgi:hypothetical protein
LKPAEDISVEYEPTPDDLRACVGLFYARTESVLRFRATLHLILRILLTAAGLILAYLFFFWWRRICALAPLPHGIPLTFRGAVGLLGAVWALLCWVTVSLGSNTGPNWIQMKARDWTTARVLKGFAPGRRTLKASAEGLELQGPNVRHARAWAQVRRARRDDRHLIILARGVWFLIPLHALDEEHRRRLLAALEARVPVERAQF